MVGEPGTLLVDSKMVLMCVWAGSHAHTVVQLWPLERRPLRGVAGGHLHGGDQLSGPGRAGAKAQCRKMEILSTSCAYMVLKMMK